MRLFYSGLLHKLAQCNPVIVFTPAYRLSDYAEQDTRICVAQFYLHEAFQHAVGDFHEAFLGTIF